MPITGKFIMSGVDIFNKKVYVLDNGDWTERKSDAKVFSVGEAVSCVKKRTDITKIKIEWI